ncbi:UNKNOWN [Stylonychia lemnae]|uniref:Uncharacterized protein n=1 Tax=Stylonychia lemnae TaxID=5949 RepID=A0A078AF10_STYLE|nr:UNKNOWN [Stylonychia lemnae]|eukprot:CDW79493.1 UNKNOWN [Stylonychia lemnae]
MLTDTLQEVTFEESKISSFNSKLNNEGQKININNPTSRQNILKTERHILPGNKQTADSRQLSSRQNDKIKAQLYNRKQGDGKQKCVGKFNLNDSQYKSRSQSSSRSSIESGLGLSKQELYQKLNEMKNCIDIYKTSKLKVSNLTSSVANGPGPVQKMMNKSELIKSGILNERREQDQKKKVYININNEYDTQSSNEKSFGNKKSNEHSTFTDAGLDGKYLRESNDISISRKSSPLLRVYEQSLNNPQINRIAITQVFSEDKNNYEQQINQTLTTNDNNTFQSFERGATGHFNQNYINSSKNQNSSLQSEHETLAKVSILNENCCQQKNTSAQQNSNYNTQQSSMMGITNESVDQPQQPIQMQSYPFKPQNSVNNDVNNTLLNTNGSNYANLNQNSIQSGFYDTYNQVYFNNIGNTTLANQSAYFNMPQSPRQQQQNLNISDRQSVKGQLSPQNIQGIFGRLNNSIYQPSNDIIQEYVQMIERLQRENQDYKLKLDLREKEISILKDQNKDYENKISVHDRIEQTLKDKIHQLQQDYYISNREKVDKIQDEEAYAQKLMELQGVLCDLEMRFDMKEREAENTYKENQTLQHELQKSELKKQELLQKIQEFDLMLREKDSIIDAYVQDIQILDNDCMFYKEKYEQMQFVIDGCSQQMQDFEQVNQMSCDLIEKLQTEVEFYKIENEQLRNCAISVTKTKSDITYQQENQIIKQEPATIKKESIGNQRVSDQSRRKSRDHSPSLVAKKLNNNDRFIKVHDNCDPRMMVHSPSASQYSGVSTPQYQQDLKKLDPSPYKLEYISPAKIEYNHEPLNYYLSPISTDQTIELYQNLRSPLENKSNAVFTHHNKSSFIPAEKDVDSLKPQVIMNEMRKPCASVIQNQENLKQYQPVDANIDRLQSEHEKKLERFRLRMQQNAVLEQQLSKEDLEVINDIKV